MNMPLSTTGSISTPGFRGRRTIVSVNTESSLISLAPLCPPRVAHRFTISLCSLDVEIITNSQRSDYLVGQPTTSRGGHLFLLLPCHQFHISHRNTIVITRSISVIGAITGVKPGAWQCRPQESKRSPSNHWDRYFRPNQGRSKKRLLYKRLRLEAPLSRPCSFHMSLMKT